MVRWGFVFLIPFMCFLLSCGGKTGRAPVPFSPAPGADPTQHRDEADEELARIAGEARDNLAVFFRRLQRPHPGDGDFRIKYPLKADPGSGFSREQIWLKDIRFKDGLYYGILTNTPYYVSGYARGDSIVFDTEEITDWMFIQNGKITGGHSIKYLLEQIPEHERDEEQRRILGMFE